MHKILFPSAEWLTALLQKLNGDGRYGEVARNWEGDLLFDIRADEGLEEPVTMYLDLWHGACRAVEYGASLDRTPPPRFVLESAYRNFTAVLSGTLNPMTAMMTNRLKVRGDLGYMMRNVPTVLDFVRCCREIPAEMH